MAALSSAISAPCPRRLRRAGAGSRPSARAAAPRGGARRAPPWSRGRSPAESRSTSMRWASRRDTRSMRALMSIVSRISCFSSVERPCRSRPCRRAPPAISTPWIAASNSGGACGSSCTASTACPLRWTKRASMSADIVVGSANPQHAGDEERPAVEELDDLEALLALADEVVGAVGRRDVAHDVGDRAHPVHVDRQRIARPRHCAASGCRPGAARASPAAPPQPSAGGRP